MWGVPPRSVIGGEAIVNRSGQQMDGEDREKVGRGKVGGASADEVRERGAFRIVNRIS
jgi:hypothetical protein